MPLRDVFFSTLDQWRFKAVDSFEFIAMRDQYAKSYLVGSDLCYFPVIKPSTIVVISQLGAVATSGLSWSYITI
ncbi:uncharacterized protein G2W53_025080 [Senna tora]|uniref:Uncharacterized protein n=1 Tax=Senna tora TaxID=362788 RepID=A0A834TEN9_9FABA|nr:uncharacterized protein G2W53_025080 [Senna tora]